MWPSFDLHEFVNAWTVTLGKSTYKNTQDLFKTGTVLSVTF